MKLHRVIALLCLALVLLATTWLIYCSTHIGNDLFHPGSGVSVPGPSSTMIVTAQDGAEFRIENGKLEVLSGSAGYSGFTKYHAPLVYAMAVPFALILGFAVLWCVSLFRKRDPHDCSKCGYDLRGNLAKVKCPECGTPAAKLTANYRIKRIGQTVARAGTFSETGYSPA